jgi:hypothetical protein
VWEVTVRAVFNASKYPNVASAKLASMHGCEIYNSLDLFTPELDKAHISAIFSWERPLAEEWKLTLEDRGCAVEWGGPGISTETRRDIEDYPLEGFSHSYTSVGCIRDCPWCIVPRMWDGVRELDEWGYAPVMLDSNILATSDKHKRKVIDCLGGRRVNWEAGLDTRLLDKDNAEFVERTSASALYLAWDSGDDDEPLVKALENLYSVGVNPPHRTTVYILTGYEGGWESGWYRAQRCKDLGVTPFIMLYQPLYGEKIIYPRIYRELARWCNKKKLLWSADFDKVCRSMESSEHNKSVK